jgi:hypothetical protein
MYRTNEKKIEFMSKDLKPIIHGIRVDLSALHTIRHKCNPETCRHCPSCCSRYVPHVSRSELERIVGCFPIIARYTPIIKNSHGFENVFEECDDASYCIDANEDESCVFSYAKPSGETLCALHSSALDLRVSPVDLKPKACSLWPLTLSEETEPELSVDRNWREFPCNTLSDNDRRMDTGVMNIVASCFGVSFLRQLL